MLLQALHDRTVGFHLPAHRRQGSAHRLKGDRRVAATADAREGAGGFCLGQVGELPTIGAQRRRERELPVQVADPLVRPRFCGRDRPLEVLAQRDLATEGGHRKRCGQAYGEDAEDDHRQQQLALLLVVGRRIPLQVRPIEGRDEEEGDDCDAEGVEAVADQLVRPVEGGERRHQREDHGQPVHQGPVRDFLDLFAQGLCLFNHFSSPDFSYDGE